ncbi:MAG: hypothetical protein ACTSUE_09975 [Promethearchaeota archaeon]
MECSETPMTADQDLMDCFEGTIFTVPDPACANCHDGSLDFRLFENYMNDGIDWCQWYCKDGCGYYYNVEIL